MEYAAFILVVTDLLHPLTLVSTCWYQDLIHCAEACTTVMQEEGVRSHRQAGLKVLVRLQGQGNNDQPLGPWALDMEQKSMKEVTSSPCQNMQPK